MTKDQTLVYGCVPKDWPGETVQRIARRADLPATLVQVILEHVLLALGHVSRVYLDRTYLWSRTERGDREAGRESR